MESGYGDSYVASRRLRAIFASASRQALAKILEAPLTAGSLRGVMSLEWGIVLDKSPKPSDARNAFALWLGTPLAPAEELSQAAGVIRCRRRQTCKSLMATTPRRSRQRAEG